MDYVEKCHSNFAFLLELEQKYGEDALISTGLPRYSVIHHQKEKMSAPL